MKVLKYSISASIVLLSILIFGSRAYAPELDIKEFERMLQLACQAMGVDFDNIRPEIRREIHNSITNNTASGESFYEAILDEVEHRKGSIRQDRFVRSEQRAAGRRGGFRGEGKRAGRGEHFRRGGKYVIGGIALGLALLPTIVQAATCGPTSTNPNLPPCNYDRMWQQAATDVTIAGVQFIPVVGQVATFYLIADGVIDTSVDAILRSYEAEAREEQEISDSFTKLGFIIARDISLDLSDDPLTYPFLSVSADDSVHTYSREKPLYINMENVKLCFQETAIAATKLLDQVRVWGRDYDQAMRNEYVSFLPERYRIARQDVLNVYTTLKSRLHRRASLKGFPWYGWDTGPGPGGSCSVFYVARQQLYDIVSNYAKEKYQQCVREPFQAANPIRGSYLIGVDEANVARPLQESEVPMEVGL